MKCLNGEYYVEVKDHRYKSHPTENIILQNEILRLLSELNNKFKMKLKYGEIRK